MNKAIIDIGSNSVRLYLTKSRKKYIETTMLASNMLDGILHFESIDRTITAVKKLIDLANASVENGMANAGYVERGVPNAGYVERGVPNAGYVERGAASAGYVERGVPNGRGEGVEIFIFATEAVRAAQNQDEFLRALRAVTDKPLDILSTKEEALVAFLGAASQSRGRCGVVDIGGASTEYAYGENNNIVYSGSLPIGAIALKNRCQNNPTALKDYINSQISKFDNSFDPQVLFGIGGTVTSLAAMDLQLKVYDPQRVHGHKLTLDSLKRLEEVIFSGVELTEVFATLKATRASIIGQGVCLLTCLLPYFGKQEIIVSEQDNLEGYILYKKI